MFRGSATSNVHADDETRFVARRCAAPGARGRPEVLATRTRGSATPA